MKEKDIIVKRRSYAMSELSESDQRLIEAARGATYRSYAPYSHFNVGAAIAMGNGEIVSGSNQENAAYPSGTCAERTAAYYASATYPDVPMHTIAIAARNVAESSEAGFQNRPISPCGACRQALLEYEHKYGPIRVLLYGTDEVYEFESVASMLPYCFTDF